MIYGEINHIVYRYMMFVLLRGSSTQKSIETKKYLPNATITTLYTLLNSVKYIFFKLALKS